MDAFDLQFNSYINTIIEVLRRRVLYQNHALDSDTIRGKTILELEQLIRTELQQHILDRRAHGLSYKDIGAMSKSKILGRFGSMQNATLIPITSVPLLTSKITPNWTDSRVTIQGFSFVFNGMDYTINTSTITLLPGTTSYLKIIPDTKTGLNNTIVNTLDGTVQPNTIHFARVNRSNNTISAIKVVRVGAHHFSKTPSGGGIPVSEGVSYVTGTLNNGWK